MPVLKDNQGQVVEPSNLMLHNNEASMLLVDQKNKSRVLNFDLEKGAIVDEFQVKDPVVQMTHEFKNAQTDAGSLFHGIA